MLWFLKSFKKRNLMYFKSFVLRLFVLWRFQNLFLKLYSLEKLSWSFSHLWHYVRSDVSCWLRILWSNEDPAGLKSTWSYRTHYGLGRPHLSERDRGQGFLTAPGPGFSMSRTDGLRTQPGGSRPWGGDGEPELWSPAHVHPEPAAGLRVSAVLQIQLDVSTDFSQCQTPFKKRPI